MTISLSKKEVEVMLVYLNCNIECSIDAAHTYPENEDHFLLEAKSLKAVRRKINKGKRK